MKNDLLLKIAQKGYAVGYGANLNFATYDIVTKLPGRIAFLSIVAGILGLGWPEYAAKSISVMILIMGISSIYIERFASAITSYSDRGKKNTEQLNELKNLYLQVKSMDEGANFQPMEELYSNIEKAFNDSSEPNQIALSNWLAHYKLFGEKNVSWMDEQLHFKFWRDKIPQTAKVCIYMFILVILAYYCVHVPVLNKFFSGFLYIN